MRSLSLRARLTWVVGLTAVVAVIAAVFAASFVTHRELVRSVDRSLLEIPIPAVGGNIRPRQRLAIEFQVLDRLGDVVPWNGSTNLPVNRADIRAASTGARIAPRSVEVDGERFRMATRPTRDGAIQVARSLTETEETIQAVRRRMMSIGAFGAALAALAGWLIGSREARPIQQLTAAAEHVAATQDLTTRIPDAGAAEVGSLSRSMSSMLAALQTSRHQQQRLIQDASHELRTPLTSLRANTELLRRYEELPPRDRLELVDDLQRETEALTSLVAEMVELATDHRSTEPMQRADINDIARSVARRFERRSGRTISVVTDPVGNDPVGNNRDADEADALAERQPAAARGALSHGNESDNESGVVVRVGQLDRAISNLVENAIKFSPTDLPIELSVLDRRIEVRDHGPGIPDADLGRIFDRFYRSHTTRTMPGSGLGLAIVQQFAVDHGGHTFASNHPDGGAIVGFAW